MIRHAKAVLATAVTAALAAALTACSVLPGGQGYRVTAYFTKAVSFYPGSRVQVMGVNIGRVEDVVPDGDRVKVVATIDDGVPLPASVTAAIVPLSLIGERTLTFTPAWKPGDARLSDGAVIPKERTSVPVEVNDALRSFSTLLGSFDPTKTDALLDKSGRMLSGNGAGINQALEQTARLADAFAGQDERLLKVADDLNRLASVVRGREKVLGSLVDDFGKTSRALQEERADIKTLIESAADLAEKGGVLIKMYQGTLPRDIVSLGQIALTLQGNAESLGKFLEAMPGLSYQFVNGYDEKQRAVVSRVSLDNFLRAYVTAILREPRPNSQVPCPLPPPYSNCI
ncbi:MCE family protein [Actinocorallia sp. A-T 12471]|uniref:MCE family protein n=1 Tax=Actinocorallia sp. A-T 12471 TaxID=3089813 RepID=UPI0029D28D75|nr:MCE family protein [Actinocorallia sp. A-T 12471]MDX6741479.1 MCE family protein [Actinocorallia sp. A-T 12471]